MAEAADGPATGGGCAGASSALLLLFWFGLVLVGLWVLILVLLGHGSLAHHDWRLSGGGDDHIALVCRDDQAAAAVADGEPGGSAALRANRVFVDLDRELAGEIGR